MGIKCIKHNHWYHGAKCDKCIDKLPPYKYSRDEVADPHDWKRFVNKGWVQ